MNPSEPLRDLLENLAKGYTGGGEVEVQFDDQPRITQDGETVYVWTEPGDVLGVDLDGPNEFRVIRDALNHEAAHYNYSDLSGKAEFAARYPDFRKLAGAVCNRLEDSYIDSRRLSGRDGYPGLRGAHALFAESQMATADGVDELDRSEALVRCVDYYALAGRVPGIRDADPEVREFAAWAKPRIEDLRRTDDAEGREELMTEIMDELVRRMPDRPDLSDLAQDIAEAASGELPDEADIENCVVEVVEPEDVPEDAETAEIDPEDLDPETLEDLAEQADADEAESGEGEPGGADAPGDDPEDGTDAETADGGESAGESEDGDEQGDGEGAGDEADESADEAGQGDGDGEAEDGADGDADADGESDGDGSDADDDADGEARGESGETEGRSTDDDGAREDEATEDPTADLMDDLADLDERDERGESPEFHDAGEDYAEASEADERRYERVEDDAAYATETDMGRRKSRRDERAQAANVGPSDVTSDEVRRVLRESGLAADIRKAFEQFATQDTTVRSEDGDRLNTEAAVRHMAGDYSETQVYETDYTAATGGRCIGVALDASNSMNSDGSELVTTHLGGGTGAIVDAKIALGAIHLAAHELGDDLVSSAFHSPNAPSTPLITGPGESFEWSHLDGVTYGGTTPTAHAVLDTLELIREQGGNDEIMLVVTDGLPKDGHPDLDGATYAEDAAIAVNMARAQGVGVIGIGVGSGVREGKMAQMFGSDGYVLTDSDNLVSELVDIYADELDYDTPPGY